MKKNIFSLSSPEFALVVFEFLLSAAAVAGSEWNTASGKEGSTWFQILVVGLSQTQARSI